MKMPTLVPDPVSSGKSSGSKKAPPQKESLWNGRHIAIGLGIAMSLVAAYVYRDSIAGLFMAAPKGDDAQPKVHEDSRNVLEVAKPPQENSTIALSNSSSSDERPTVYYSKRQLFGGSKQSSFIGNQTAIEELKGLGKTHEGYFTSFSERIKSAVGKFQNCSSAVDDFAQTCLESEKQRFTDQECNRAFQNTKSLCLDAQREEEASLCANIVKKRRLFIKSEKPIRDALMKMCRIKTLIA